MQVVASAWPGYRVFGGFSGVAGPKPTRPCRFWG